MSLRLSFKILLAFSIGILFNSGSFTNGGFVKHSITGYRSSRFSFIGVKQPSVEVASGRSYSSLSMGASQVDGETAAVVGFIDSELRGAAMRLHTTQQSPKEGQVVEQKPAEPYVQTLDDYLAFLVDSCYIYQALEDIVEEKEELQDFRRTGLERTVGLKSDIQYMVDEYDLVLPSVGKPGNDYASKIREIGRSDSIPAFMCHYYNFYFAHTAGGRMIGKSMSDLLLNKKTLEFYKWDGNVNKIKGDVKENIERMAAGWSRSEKDQCVDETMEAFRGGGSVNQYLGRGKNNM